MVEISVVVPVYNSCDCLEELARQINIALKNLAGYELILVNDKSSDKSWDKITELVWKDPHIKGINLRKNSGQDNALMAGLRNASGKYSVIMDDDLQHSPHDIPRLYNHIKKNNSDVVYAVFKRKNQALWKNICSWLNGKIAQIVIGKPKGIYMSPFKIIHHGVVHEIIKYRGLYPYIDGLIFGITDCIGEVTVEHHKRYKGRSNYNMIRSFSVFLKLATGFSIFPLRLASYMGIIIAIIGFALGLFYVCEYFLLQHNVEGWTTLVAIELFKGGMILFCIGIVGEYLGRAFLIINERPQYTIKDLIISKKAVKRRITNNSKPR